LAVDPARTAFDDSLLRDEDPVTSYAAFAAAATVFVDGPVGHVSTLFPPVRPRGTYLEVRFLDALEPDAVERAVAVLKQLMYDDVRRRDVLRALEGSCSAQLWRAAAAGVLDQEVAA
jgi:glutamate--cysteine ligase